MRIIHLLVENLAKVLLDFLKCMQKSTCFRNPVTSNDCLLNYKKYHKLLITCLNNLKISLICWNLGEKSRLFSKHRHLWLMSKNRSQKPTGIFLFCSQYILFLSFAQVVYLFSAKYEQQKQHNRWLKWHFIFFCSHFLSLLSIFRSLLHHLLHKERYCFHIKHPIDDISCEIF